MNSSPSPVSVDLHVTGLFRSTGGDLFGLDPFTFVQNHLGDLRSSGANIEFVIQNNPSETGFRLPANFGDYFMGPGLEQLTQQLAENDPNRYGTPPASKSAIDSLPSVKITKDLLNSNSNQCAVCMDDFEEGIEGKRMPCEHLYHKDCILPWLELHNSCPVCRYELPTDDPDYERRVRGEQGTSGGNAGADNGQRSAGVNRTVERSFRISLPRSFQARDQMIMPIPCKKIWIDIQQQNISHHLFLSWAHGDQSASFGVGKQNCVNMEN
ncbi:RNF181 protein [Hibiscus syriacus]|uniref:RING-type E3 ubiquitin transferase n=1 Tax=Hibiscus syriacus TaxID=106335 RepID=A0A6A2XMW2_HIBSY|nr:RNF181 protein [Hibiscus syriacus]